MLLSYVKRRWKIIAALALFALIFALVFSLYELPAEAVLYASLLCIAAGVLLIAASYAAYRRRVKSLETLRRTICVGTDGLPEPRDRTEELYQELISTLEEVRQIQADGAAKRAEAEVELGRIEGELKQKLLELRG